MDPRVFECGPFANDSERKAFEQVRCGLASTRDGGAWVLLTNLAFSVTHRMQADEIDLVAIGPPGVRVVEVKHWAPEWVDANPELVEQEADKVTHKARRIGTTLRRSVPELGRVDGAMLLTRESGEASSGRAVRGVGIHTLTDWRDAIGFDAAEPASLRPPRVAMLSRLLEPKSAVALDGSLRRFAGYVNLELRTPKAERFHRVYAGVHSSRQDRVILHLYDLSASDDANAEKRARREFEVLRRLQLHDWAPRILDSFQDAPGYAGEMHFFTVVDPVAPSIEKRKSDASWATSARLAFARNAVRALRELHGTAAENGAVAHRNLTARTILVRHDGQPILTGFEWSKIPSDVSVASSGAPAGGWDQEVAPEVRAGGRHAAGQRSDVYSLCASLTDLFQGRDEESRQVVDVLAGGLADDPDARRGLEDLENALAELLGETPPTPPPPPARFWTEEQVVPFHGREYRVVGRLGSGGVGTTFKVVELDSGTEEYLGTYVAKVAHDEETGRRTVGAYGLARSHLRHQAVSVIFEVARDWAENQFTALLTWIDGSPLSDFTGVFPLLAQDQQEESGEALAVRWLRTMCEALDVLHRNGLVHGDVSPRNMIVSGGDLVLTDYDFVRKIGETGTAPGTVLYCAPSSGSGPGAPTDDIYALAASFFHVLFEREPFRYDGNLAKERGLRWEELECAEYPAVADFFDRATNPDANRRFGSASEALEVLRLPPITTAIDTSPDVSIPVPETDAGSGGASPDAGERRTVTDVGVPGATDERREQSVPWLRSLLQSYPGSRYGNRETRGLDSKFAERTYVETPLETALRHAVLDRRARLVVLCGNAGDGKTALLQHLAERFGVGRRESSERILEGETPDGLIVRINLDGSASWRGKSADDLLDEFLKPFQDGPPEEDVAHLLAINDGRLLEWIERLEERRGETPLTRTLRDHFERANGSAPDIGATNGEAEAGAAGKDAAAADVHVRFINLNQRSLVGGVTADGTGIATDFLEQLLDGLYGGKTAAETWAPCRTCSAQERCEVFRANRLFGPDALAGGIAPEVRARARERLFHALQAVHLRGETHVTMRELRAALVYVLFGVYYCDDYHRGGEEAEKNVPDVSTKDLDPSVASYTRQGDLFDGLAGPSVDVDAEATSNPLPYWERAFDPTSPARQGELLRELVRFDPALESHPRLDRRLLRDYPTDRRLLRDHPGALASARRRAYFEWTEERLRAVAQDGPSLDLHQGRYLRRFRNIPVDRSARDELCRKLCAGISRLEELPPGALNRSDVVPLRIPPRTPTETWFWIEKRLAAFRLEADLPPWGHGLDRLHRQAFLVYRYRDGREERLRLGAELFHLLLDLSDGYQLGDVATDDTFAHLSIFVQRLVREDDRRIFALSPMSRAVRVISVETSERQQIVIRPDSPKVSE